MNTMFPHAVGITPGLNNAMSLGLGLYPDATSLLNYDNESNSPNPGDVITGGTSGATATVIGVSPLVAAGSRNVYVTDVVGTFQNNEVLSVGVTTIGDMNGTAGAYNPNNDAPLVSMYLLEAAPNGVLAGQKGDIGILLSGATAVWYGCDGGTTWRTFTLT